ncbi:hypothetical protein FRC08_003204 [Ceratobasidium sp. 394]|nr:hypothetical protein FRC08_003204 [Ceratobasidium sp. 394]
MANFRPYDWEQFQETPFDREVKAKLEQALNVTLPKWSMIVWGPRAMLYDPTPEMFSERGDRTGRAAAKWSTGPMPRSAEFFPTPITALCRRMKYVPNFLSSQQKV